MQANGAVLTGDAELAVAAVTGLAELIFEIEPFGPEPLPGNWKDILRAWLLGQQIADVGAQTDTEVVQFVDAGLVYRLPWGMEALRVRALASSWQHQPHPGIGSPVHLIDNPNGGSTLVLSPDLELVGTLRRKLNVHRCGLTLAVVSSGNHVDVTYLGPDELLS